MPKTVSKEATEAERRQLVKNIAERGTRAYDAVETTVAPSRDYSKAARAAVAADPVELPPSAQAELGEITDAPAQTASRYSEALRSIFGQGRDRELAYGNQFYDDAGTVIDATNRELSEHEADLIKARELQAAALREQEAAAAARRTGGGGGGGRRSGSGSRSSSGGARR